MMEIRNCIIIVGDESVLMGEGDVMAGNVIFLPKTTFRDALRTAWDVLKILLSRRGKPIAPHVVMIEAVK